ncbi:MAG: outer membrane beta-barrel protein [Aquisalimonadaceae bacterium]
MLKRTTFIPLVIIGLITTPAGVSGQAATQSELRAYLGGGLGYYRLNDEDFLDEDENLKDDRSAWKAFGGFEINRVFSLEVGYTDFGRTEDGNATMEADGWTIAGIAALPLTQYFAPYAKVGQLFWDRKREYGPLSRSDDGNDLFYGVGARFMLTDHTDLRLEYDRLALNDTDLDMGSINLQFRF